MANTLRIPLTQGKFAVIDADDAWALNHKWYAVAGRNGCFYAVRNIPNGKGGQTRMALHRAVMGLVSGCDKKDFVDHVNGDGLNCTKKNLRIVSALENNRNVSGVTRANKSSPYRGVHALPYGRWRASISDGKRKVHIGTFASPEEANAARKNAEIDLWGIQPRRKDFVVD